MIFNKVYLSSKNVFVEVLNPRVLGKHPNARARVGDHTHNKGYNKNLIIFFLLPLTKQVTIKNFKYKIIFALNQNFEKTK